MARTYTEEERRKQICSKDYINDTTIETVLTPAGRYQISTYEFREHALTKGFVYSGATVKNAKNGKVIAALSRNYPEFPWTIMEGHPDGHDYLIFSNDLKGYSVLQIDTGIQQHHIGKDGDPVLSEAMFSPDKKWLLAIEAGRGSLYDFTNPMELPYMPVEEFYAEDFEWNEKSELVLRDVCIEVRGSDKKPVEDLSPEEKEALDDIFINGEWNEMKEVYDYVEKDYIWIPGEGYRELQDGGEAGGKVE